MSLKRTHTLTLSALFIAIGSTLGAFISIPFGVAKAYPIQHLINVLSAVILGPFYAVANAFFISLFRNMMGTGSLLAFPGSMIGALLASLLYRKIPKVHFALIGEVIGTGLIGALVAYPMAQLFLGSSHAATFFIVPFAISSLSGALIAWIMIKALAGPLKKWFNS